MCHGVRLLKRVNVHVQVLGCVRHRVRHRERVYDHDRELGCVCLERVHVHDRELGCVCYHVRHLKRVNVHDQELGCVCHHVRHLELENVLDRDFDWMCLSQLGVGGEEAGEAATGLGKQWARWRVPKATHAREAREKLARTRALGLSLKLASLLQEIFEVGFRSFQGGKWPKWEEGSLDASHNNGLRTRCDKHVEIKVTRRGRAENTECTQKDGWARKLA